MPVPGTIRVLALGLSFTERRHAQFFQKVATHLVSRYESLGQQFWHNDEGRHPTPFQELEGYIVPDCDKCKDDDCCRDRMVFPTQGNVDITESSDELAFEPLARGTHLITHKLYDLCQDLQNPVTE